MATWSLSVVPYLLSRVLKYGPLGCREGAYKGFPCRAPAERPCNYLGSLALTTGGLVLQIPQDPRPPRNLPCRELMWRISFRVSGLGFRV